LDTIKGYLCVLTVFVVSGTLGQISSSHEGQQKSQLFNSNSFIHRLHLLDGLVQKRYVFLEDGSIKNSKKSLKRFPIGDSEFLTNPNSNLHWEVFLNRVRSSFHILFFATLLLRSPPLFF
jgi:hypothetical protein